MNLEWRVVQAQLYIICQLCFLALLRYTFDTKWDVPTYAYVAEYLSHKNVDYFHFFVQNPCTYDKMHSIHSHNIAAFASIDQVTLQTYMLLRFHMCPGLKISPEIYQPFSLSLKSQV